MLEMIYNMKKVHLMNVDDAALTIGNIILLTF